MVKNKRRSPDQHGSAGWVSSGKVKGHQFNYWSRHMPGLLVGPWWGACQRQPIDVSLTHQCFSAYLSPACSFSLKIKKFKKIVNADHVKIFNFYILTRWSSLWNEKCFLDLLKIVIYHHFVFCINSPFNLSNSS